MNTDVLQLLPGLLRHESAAVRLAAAWAATNLAFDAAAAASPHSPVSPSCGATPRVLPSSQRSCLAMRAQRMLRAWRRHGLDALLYVTSFLCAKIFLRVGHQYQD